MFYLQGDIYAESYREFLAACFLGLVCLELLYAVSLFTLYYHFFSFCSHLLQQVFFHVSRLTVRCHFRVTVNKNIHGPICHRLAAQVLHLRQKQRHTVSKFHALLVVGYSFIVQLAKLLNLLVNFHPILSIHSLRAHSSIKSVIL